MKRLFLLFCLLALGVSGLRAQTLVCRDSVDWLHPKLRQPDSIYRHERMERKRPWHAAAQVFTINAGVWAFDRYVLNADFAKISAGSIRHNIKNGFVWDNDQFSTNLFAHPYHGNLYFNAARSNGLSFWESAPYSFAGSLMWEMAAEVEPAAINDLIGTTVGGIALGEFTHRMSSLVLDDSKRGFARFGREFLGALINPIRGLNRLINGDMWRVRRSHYRYHDYESIPVNFSIGAGHRYLADDAQLFKGDHNPYVELRVQYGDAFDRENDRPYDYFTARASFGLSANQPLINQINLVGKLWDTSVKSTKDMEMKFGLYQHFNYFDSEEVLEGSGRIPYKISEAASLGPGLICRFPKVNNITCLEQRIFLSGILLGGSLTDYYNVIDRNYNMGSGYSIKNNTILDFGAYGMFALNMHFYQIFTWKGYEHKDLENVNPLYLNAQGDKGNMVLAVVNPIVELNLSKHLRINAEISYYFRHTHYSFHDDVEHTTFETRIGLLYDF